MKKHSCMFSKTCSLWKLTLLWLFPANFHKMLVENHCHCRQIRSEQILTSVTVLKHCIITEDISRWSEITLKKYIEMRLHRKDTAKRLSFLKYRKLINKGQSDHVFFLLKTHQMKFVESKMCVKMTSIICPSKLEQNLRTKMLLWLTQNQRCFNFKFRRWFNVDKLIT